MPTDEPEHWEYDIVLLTADAKRERDFPRTTWPDIEFPRYAPQSLIPQLNDAGAMGWELVSIQPVVMGMNGDVISGGGSGMAARDYLCTFKRRMSTRASIPMPHDPS